MKKRAILFTSHTLALAALAFYGCQSNPNISGGPGKGQGEDDGSGGRYGDDNIDVPLGGAGGATDTGSGGCNQDAGSCEPELPVPDPACGDGRLNVVGETCDDGNGDSGDGCTANCTLEADFVCPTPGKPCVNTVICGDGKITGNETCDDSNDDSNDGCSSDCQVEEGWSCLNVGLRCQAASCGDSLVAGFEECDFGSDVTGCVSCKIVDGYDCDEVGCFETECGNDVVERGEQCEDGNERPFDGCYACNSEPDCQDGVCTPVCGDGQRYDSEQCDDGNTRNGDGCSSDCKEETGFACVDVEGAPPSEIKLPVIYRDFIGKNQSLIDTATCYNARSGELPTAQKTIPCFHINFDGLSGTSLQNVVETELGPDGTPDLYCPAGDCSSNPGTQTNNFTTNEDFDDWYDDESPQNISIFRELTLPLQGGLTYKFQPPSGGFYPIDDAGWVVSGEEWLRSGKDGGCQDVPHNYSFSTETRFIFEYQGGERFDFNGDDDLWVFVNGKLAIDLAGLHGPRAGYFQLDDDTDAEGPDTADGTAIIDNPLIPETTIDLGLTVGGTYEVALFHAERNYCGSNFELTLKDFNKPKSECSSDCGDGVVASDELCDDGPTGNDGTYGKCASNCLARGSHCGDATTDGSEGEECDDGINLSTYGTGCSPGCKLPPSCGDGVVQSAFEDCDDGENDGGYGECAAGCVLGPRCGDGKLDKTHGEECDDGNRKNNDGCNVNCKDETNIIR